ncbi:MAG: cyclase family protein [Myxococcaceae bacterium]|nr:cyclase family protein [Myxococcaceae bacterium]MCI0669585.1 cyclase family protein [Myxococcaceae bacterium]
MSQKERGGGAARVWYDISPPLSPRTAVFPGDTHFAREVALHFDAGDNLVLSSICSTLHVGAHVDAPLHYHPDGESIDTRPLDLYYGDCQVLSVQLPRGERIRPQHLGEKDILAPRVLLRTGSFPNPEKWNGDFNALSSELVEHLSDRGVLLVGLDTPSVDPAEDKVLESHNAVYRRNMALLEGIMLDAVPDGLYTLIALPLRLVGADASPVRAVLLKQDGASSLR